MKKPLTPLKAMRSFCRYCCCDDLKAIRGCPTASCPIHLYREGKIPLGASGRLLSVIHSYCVNCAGTPQAARACTMSASCNPKYTPCPLHPYRHGRRPLVSDAARERGRIQAEMNFKNTRLDRGSSDSPPVPPAGKIRVHAVRKSAEGGRDDEHEG